MTCDIPGATARAQKAIETLFGSAEFTRVSLSECKNGRLYQYKPGQESVPLHFCVLARCIWSDNIVTVHVIVSVADRVTEFSCIVFEDHPNPADTEACKERLNKVIEQAQNRVDNAKETSRFCNQDARYSLEIN